MTVEDALLAAIAANPSDATVHAAYADWLYEHDRDAEAVWHTEAGLGVWAAALRVEWSVRAVAFDEPGVSPGPRGPKTETRITIHGMPFYAPAGTAIRNLWVPAGKATGISPASFVATEFDATSGAGILFNKAWVVETESYKSRTLRDLLRVVLLTGPPKERRCASSGQRKSPQR